MRADDRRHESRRTRSVASETDSSVGLSTCRRGSSLADALGVTIAREREEDKGERARAGSTDRSRSAAKKIWMVCVQRVPLARVAPGSRLTLAKEDEAGRRGSDAAAGLAASSRLRHHRRATATPTAIATPDRSTVLSQCREPYRSVSSTLAVPHPPFATSGSRNLGK